jgi:AcrR family transcriptional regulator
MARTEEQNAKLRQLTKEKIQSAAGQLFAEKGLVGTSVQEIADLAGISIGLLYRHYKTKEELFGELVAFAREGLEHLTTLFQTSQTPTETFQQIAEEIVSDLEHNDDFIHTMIFMTRALLSNPEVGGVYKLIEQDKVMIEAASKLIQQGQQSGEMHQGDALKMAMLFFSTIQGIGIMRAVMKKEHFVPTAKMILAPIVIGKDESDG